MNPLPHILSQAKLSGDVLKLCKNHCSDIRTELPRQMKQSFYQNTERIRPGGTLAASAVPNPYEQPFPGYEDDFRYFTRMYPSSVRNAVPAVREACNRLEYKGSLMFDQYPAREAILSVINPIAESTQVSADTVMLLLLHEFMRRRERYRNSVTEESCKNNSSLIG